ncbi:M14 family metallopeptidase [Chitinivorax sp. B]|uniref:M14 family metallopeptidase n=1 Tax=Chitinivorax sp. B TaxID=2502235 RepID=UPI0010F99A6A|nr:M14 family metallopeptidase [Chitinivorax sp. B]
MKRALTLCGFVMFTNVALGPIAVAAPSHGPETLQLLEQEKANNNIYKAYFPSQEIARKAAISFHEQMLESHYDKGYLILELDQQELDKLSQFGFRFEPATEFIAQRNQILDQLQQIQAKRRAIDPMAADVELTAIPGYSCYETVEETYAAAQGFTVTKPNLATWTDVGDSWQKTKGLGGYDIRVLKLTNKLITTPKPKLFINAAIHAREYTTAPLVLSFARWLLDGYGVNADATWILDNHEVHLMLHTNPDGRKKAETGLSWRKNTNQAYCGAASNSRGADLNRNFTYGWNSTNGQGSSGNPCNLTYRGPSAGSEPEIKAIEGYVRAIWPDRRGPNPGDPAPADTSGIHLDIHSYSELVLWPWGNTNNPAPNGNALRTLGRKFAYFNGYTPQQSIGLYPTDGTSDGVSYGELGVAAYTFELGTAFFQSCSTYNSTIKPRNLNALIYAAKVVRTPYITPGGPDVTSISLAGTASTTGVTAGTPVPLAAVVTDTRFNNSNGVEPTHNVAAAEYYIDVPPWKAGVALPLVATDGVFDEKSEDIKGVINTAGLSVGKHLVYVRSRDTTGTWGAVSAAFLVIKP